MQQPTLLDNFHRYFDVLPADTTELKAEAFRLRYHVYCVEQEFEDPTQFPDGQEKDAFDNQSAHSLIRHRTRGLVAATVRLVLPNREDLGQPLPIEEHCRQAFQDAGFDPHTLPRATVGEVSRFAVSKDFKRRLGEAKTTAGVSPDTERYALNESDGVRMIPHLSLGLIQSLVRMSAEHHITHWYAIMEPSLLRLLQRFGIEFLRIGGLVDYHGKRQPCYNEVEEILRGMYVKRMDLWQLVTRNGEYWPPPKDIETPVSKRASA